MSTPRWLKKLDDFLRPAYKSAANFFLRDFLKKNNIPEYLADEVIKIVPDSSNEKDVVEGLMNKINDLESENDMQERLISELVQLLVKSGIEIDYETRLKLMEAIDNG